MEKAITIGAATAFQRKGGSKDLQVAERISQIFHEKSTLS